MEAQNFWMLKMRKSMYLHIMWPLAYIVGLVYAKPVLGLLLKQQHNTVPYDWLLSAAPLTGIPQGLFSVQKHQSLSTNHVLFLGSSISQPFITWNLNNRLRYVQNRKKAWSPPKTTIRKQYLFLFTTVSPAPRRYLTKIGEKSTWTTPSLFVYPV